MSDTLDLTKVDPSEIKVISKPAASQETGTIDLTKVHPSEVKVISTPPPPAPKGPHFTAVESGLLGATQGATFGFADEIGGGLLSAVEKLSGSKEPFKQLYEQNRNLIREDTASAQADNPKSFLGGTVAGSVASSFIPGASIAKGAKVLPSIIKATGLGALTGAGYSEADPTKSPQELTEFAADTAKGGVIGGTLQGLGTGLSSAIKKATPESLRSYANDRALAAAGYMAKDTNKLSTTQQQNIGRELLDKKVVTALSSLDDIASRAKAGKEEAGQAIGKALGNVDELVADAKSAIDAGTLLPGSSDIEKASAKRFLDQNFQFNKQNIADRIRSEIIEPNINNNLLEGELNKLSKLADSFGGKSNLVLETTEGAKFTPLTSKTLPLSAANEIKATQGKITKFNSESVPDIFKQDVYRIIKTELEDIVGKTGNLEQGIENLAGKGREIGDISGLRIPQRNAEALTDYKNAKSAYGALNNTADVAEARAGQLNSNRTISLTDYIAGATGLGTGGPGAAVALGGLNKIARKYGASVQAVAADKLASGIEATLEKTPELLRRVHPLLEEAAKKGNGAIIGVHLALMKDPAYEKAFNDGETETPNAFQRRLQQFQKSP